jgi:pyridoxal phosphate enzyme (YggS family)
MIVENIRNLREKIEDSCARSGRNPSEIKLIAVSKNFGPDEVRLAAKEGITHFGENKAQELSSKAPQITENVQWHFIGHLQRNKVRFAVEFADYIHSVDSLLIATEINKYALRKEKKLNILLEFKTSKEDTKSGIVEESELFDLAGYCQQLSNVNLVGLMTIAPYTSDINIIRKSFQYLSKLKDNLNSLGIKAAELSMGMTNDFDIAIQEGATMLRIGTAIFGKRHYPQQEEEE